MIDNDTEYEKSINSVSLKAIYKEDVSDFRQTLRQDFNSQYKKQRDNLVDEIHIAESHDQLVSMSIFPFIQKNNSITNLGYHFVRCAPLLEKDVKNLDFLMHKNEGRKSIAIFGEAKSSISKPSQVIEEFIQRKQIVAKHRNYILKNYLKTHKDTIFEYVLVVYSKDAVAMRDEILNKDSGIILWVADFGMKDLRLLGESKTGKKPQISHVDHDLSKILGKGVSTTLRVPLHYVQTHIVRRLRALIATKEFINAITDTTAQKFDKENLEHYLEKSLYYLPKSLQEKERTHLINAAIDLGLISVNGDEYTLLTKAKRAKNQSSEFQKKWVDETIKKSQTLKLEQAILELRKKYTESDRKQDTVDKYF